MLTLSVVFEAFRVSSIDLAGLILRTGEFCSVLFGEFVPDEVIFCSCDEGKELSKIEESDLVKSEFFFAFECFPKVPCLDGGFGSLASLINQDEKEDEKKNKRKKPSGTGTTA